MTRHRTGRRRGWLLRRAIGAGAATVAVLSGALLATTPSGPADTSATALPNREAGAPAGDSSPAPTGGRRTAARAGVAPMQSSAPRRLVVPSIGVDTEVMDLGLDGDGGLEVPPGAFPAGWYDGSPTPGELGPAVLAGHVSWNGTPGVFADLPALRRGDAVVVERDDGSTARFTVTRTADYEKSAFPTDAVYGDLDHPGLRLITCGGLDADSGDYEQNVVVFARLDAVTAAPGRSRSSR